MCTSCYVEGLPDRQRRLSPMLLRLILLGLPVSLSSLPCHASLGSIPSYFGHQNSRQASAMATVSATSTLALQSATSYRVKTSVLDNGTTVREFVANDIVFAVAWRGPFLPDLRVLLGQHFSTLTNATTGRPHGVNNLVVIDRPDIAIESTGHMRAFAGRAWIKNLLPTGFNLDEIK
jgi:hypothetical protein